MLAAESEAYVCWTACGGALRPPGEERGERRSRWDLRHRAAALTLRRRATRAILEAVVQ